MFALRFVTPINIGGRNKLAPLPWIMEAFAHTHTCIHIHPHPHICLERHTQTGPATHTYIDQKHIHIFSLKCPNFRKCNFSGVKIRERIIYISIIVIIFLSEHVLGLGEETFSQTNQKSPDTIEPSIM